MGRFSPRSVLLLILVSIVSVVYFHSKRCHCYKFQRRSYLKYGSKFIPQRTFSESAARGRQICFTKTKANEKSLGILGSRARVFCGSQQRQGRSQDFSKGGSQRLLTRSPSGDRRLYMVYTAAFPRVSAGSVVLSRHEGPY